MRPVVVAKTGTGSSTLVPMDHYKTPFSVGIGCVVSGTVNYDIQHTFDDVQDATVTPTWFSHVTLAAATASANGNYAYPIKAIKILINSGTGTVTATIIQAG